MFDPQERGGKSTGVDTDRRNARRDGKKHDKKHDKKHGKKYEKKHGKKHDRKYRKKWKREHNDRATARCEKGMFMEIDDDKPLSLGASQPQTGAIHHAVGTRETLTDAPDGSAVSRPSESDHGVAQLPGSASSSGTLAKRTCKLFTTSQQAAARFSASVVKPLLSRKRLSDQEVEDCFTRQSAKRSKNPVFSQLRRPDSREAEEPSAPTPTPQRSLCDGAAAEAQQVGPASQFAVATARACSSRVEPLPARAAQPSVCQADFAPASAAGPSVSQAEFVPASAADPSLSVDASTAAVSLSQRLEDACPAPRTLQAAPASPAVSSQEGSHTVGAKCPGQYPLGAVSADDDSATHQYGSHHVLGGAHITCDLSMNLAAGLTDEQAELRPEPSPATPSRRSPSLSRAAAAVARRGLSPASRLDGTWQQAPADATPPQKASSQGSPQGVRNMCRGARAQGSPMLSRPDMAASPDIIEADKLVAELQGPHAAQDACLDADASSQEQGRAQASDCAMFACREQLQQVLVRCFPGHATDAIAYFCF